MWEVGLPSSVHNPRAIPGGMVAVSEGKKSDATSTEGADRSSHVSRGSPRTARSSWVPTSRTSAARAARYSSSRASSIPADSSVTRTVAASAQSDSPSMSERISPVNSGSSSKRRCAPITSASSDPSPCVRLESLQPFPDDGLGAGQRLHLLVGTLHPAGDDVGESGGVQVYRADGDTRRSADSLSFLHHVPLSIIESCSRLSDTMGEDSSNSTSR